MLNFLVVELNRLIEELVRSSLPSSTRARLSSSTFGVATVFDCVADVDCVSPVTFRLTKCFAA